MADNIFASLDPITVAFAATMALVFSLIRTAKERNAQALASKPLTPWRATVPDTVIGCIFGTLLALGAPELLPKLKTFVAVSALAALGGIVGPKLYDLISRDGLGLILSSVAQLVSGPLSTWAQKHSEPPTPPQGGGSDETSTSE